MIGRFRRTIGSYSRTFSFEQPSPQNSYSRRLSSTPTVTIHGQRNIVCLERSSLGPNPWQGRSRWPARLAHRPIRSERSHCLRLLAYPSGQPTPGYPGGGSGFLATSRSLQETFPSLPSPENPPPAPLPCVLPLCGHLPPSATVCVVLQRTRQRSRSIAAPGVWRCRRDGVHPVPGPASSNTEQAFCSSKC